MRSIKRYSATLAMLVALAVSLAGCMHVDRSVTINSDGSGSYTLAIGFSEQLISLAGDQISSSMNSYGDKIKGKGGSYRHYDDTGYSYWAYTSPFKTIAQLNKIVQDMPQTGGVTPGGTGFPPTGGSGFPPTGGSGFPPTGGSGFPSTGGSGLPTSTSSETLNFTEQQGTLSNTFHVTGHMSMVLPQGTTNTGGIDVSQYLSGLRESFSVTMPGSIISHKGGTVSGNTVSYTVHYGEETDIDVVGGGLNTSLLIPIGAGAGVVLLLIIAGIVFWRMRRGKKATQTATGAAPAFVAAAPDAPTMAESSAPADGFESGANQG